VRLRRRYLPLIALFGAALAVVPTIADSSTPDASITAVDNGIYEHSWQASGLSPAEVGITSGSTVSFSYPSGVSHHYPVFENGPATPNCTGLPTTFEQSGPGWSGSCTFSAEGTYEFWCGVHGAAMKAFVYVNAAGTISTKTVITTSSTSSTSTTATSTTHTTTTSTPPPTTTTTAQTQPSPSATTATLPPVGGPSTTTSATTTAASVPTPPQLTLAGSQHGGILHGSADIPPADGGSRLEVDLLATTASLASKHTPKQVRIGRFVRASVSAGKVSFSVSLDAQAKRALRHHHHLPVVVEITVTPPHGAPFTTTRSVILHS
jgi:plastocyanin